MKTIHTLCLGAPRQDARAAAVLLRSAAQVLLRECPALEQVCCLHAVRHIPSDSVSADRARAGVTAAAAGIGTVLELHFPDEAAAAAAAAQLSWAAFREQVNAAAPILFSLDTRSNVPIEPRGAALDGGFRRWMLLTRKAGTQEQFRDAWFGRHADLVRLLPHVDGYLQNFVTACFDARGHEAGYDTMPIDGIAELCFADEAAMDAAYASSARPALRDDGQALLGGITTILVQGETWR